MQLAQPLRVSGAHLRKMGPIVVDHRQRKARCQRAAQISRIELERAPVSFARQFGVVALREYASEVEPLPCTAGGRQCDGLPVQRLRFVERTPLAQQPGQHHHHRAKRRPIATAREGRPQQALRALHVAGVAPHDRDIGDREVVVGLQRDRSLERCQRVGEAPERAQRIAEVVECPRIARIELHHTRECLRGPSGVTAFAMEDSKAHVRRCECGLFRDGTLEARDRRSGIAPALIELRQRVMRYGIVRVELQRNLYVVARSHDVA